MIGDTYSLYPMTTPFFWRLLPVMMAAGRGSAGPERSELGSPTMLLYELPLPVNYDPNPKLRNVKNSHQLPATAPRMKPGSTRQGRWHFCPSRDPLRAEHGFDESATLQPTVKKNLSKNTHMMMCIWCVYLYLCNVIHTHPILFPPYTMINYPMLFPVYSHKITIKEILRTHQL